MGEDNIFTLFLKGVFVLILLFMLLALVLPFISSVLNTGIMDIFVNLFMYSLFIGGAIIMVLVFARLFS